MKSKIDSGLIKQVDDILFLLETKAKLGTIAVNDVTISKNLLFCDPDVAKEKINALIKGIEENAQVPFNRTSLTKDIPEIHTVMSIRLMEYFVGQKIVSEPNARGRVSFI
ncbi:MAG: hypothetical protein WC069_02915 [Candidatus Shapirobacteria bacterium]